MDVTVAGSSDKIQSCEVRTWKILSVNVIRIYRHSYGEVFPSGNIPYCKYNVFALLVQIAGISYEAIKRVRMRVRYV